LNEHILLMINVLLFLLVSIILVIYLKKTWKVNIEYSKSKNIVEEVILSFNKEIEGLKQKIEEFNIKFQNLQLPDMDQVKSELDSLSSKIEDLLGLYSTLEKKIENIEMDADKKLKMPNQRERSFKDRNDLDLLVKPAFPLKKERALASLTPTEIRVLEILLREGDKTVREIRRKIGLTREHTGRLMKSLYDKGYVERKTNRIPYVYRIKKEMESMLTKENQ